MGSIYSEIGGSEAVAMAVDRFYAKVFADPALAPYFRGVDLLGLKAHQRAFLTAALGGPGGYAGRPMAPVHAHLGITEADFDAVVGHLAATLTELDVAESTIGAIAAALLPLRAEIVSPAAASA